MELYQRMNSILFSTWLNEAAKKISEVFSVSMNDSYKEASYLANKVTDMPLISSDALSSIATYCLNKALEKRLQHMPLAKIIQKKDFYKHTFITTEDTLDPRPETEEMLNMIEIKARSVLDLGTGTGCLIISILKDFPKANGTAIDISQAALLVAKENAEILGVSKKIKFKQNNWAENIKEHFDLIVANPPYVDKLSKQDPSIQHDPELALFGDTSTYENMLKSLEKITFFQMLIEVPDFLIQSVINLPFFENYNVQIKNIGSISILNIKNKKLAEKILLQK